MRTLFILNDPPYGTERTYNGLRLALALIKAGAGEIRVFLMGDAAAAAKSGQRTPNGYYNLERMLGALSNAAVATGACGTCLDARGLAAETLVSGVHRSSMEELAAWTAWADRVLVF
jgi:uncharacterized protein involved in oxidation of intracellular sulfur